MKTKGVILVLLVALTCAPLAFAESAQDVAKADALFLKSVTAMHKKQTDTAIGLLEKSIQLSQTNGTAYLNLAALYAGDKHNYKRAEQFIKKAIQLEPTYFDYQWEYGLILIRMGQYRRAYEILNASQKLKKSPADEKLLHDKLEQLKAQLEKR